MDDWVKARHPDAPQRLSYDLLSHDPNGGIARLIEVKGRGSSTSISIPDRQRNAMLALGADWWLYVALECATDAPYLLVVKEPARLPWYLLTPPREIEEGRYRRVGDEGKWHVSPSDVLAVGERVDIAASH